MKTQKWMPPVVMKARIDPPGRATRGILILALVLGGFSAEAAATSGHAPGEKASARHMPGIHAGATARLTSSSGALRNPWMY
jgi:hypothetical protein